MKNIFIAILSLIVAGCSSLTTERPINLQQDVHNVNDSSFSTNIGIAFKLESYDKVIESLSSREKLTSEENYMLAFSFYKTGKYERAQYVLVKDPNLTQEDRYLLSLIMFKRENYKEALSILSLLNGELSYKDEMIFKSKVENLESIINCKFISNEECIEKFEQLSRIYPESDDIYSNLILSKFVATPSSKEALSRMYEDYEVSNNNVETLIIASIVTGNDDLALSLLQKKYKDKEKVMRIYETLSKSLK